MAFFWNLHTLYMSHLEKFTDENLEKIEDLFIFRPCSLVTQRQHLASVAKSIYTKLVFSESYTE